MNDMNGEERFIAALRCEEVDRMPSFWMLIERAGLLRKELNEFKRKNPLKYFSQNGRPLLLGRILARNWLSRGTSSIVPMLAGGAKIPKAYYNPETDYFYTRQEAKSLSRKQKKFQITLYGEVRQHGYRLGEKGERLHSYWWFHKHFFSGPDALQRFDDFYAEFGAPWEKEFNPNALSIKLARAVRGFLKLKGFPYAITGDVPMHFEGIWGGFGPATIGKLARKKPGKLHDICRKFEKVSLLSERNLIEAGYKIISTGDDLGQKQRALISPKIYEEFFYPALKSRCDLAHKNDAVIFMHSCGFIEEFLDLMLRAGLDGLQSLEVPAGNDLARIRAKVRDKMCLIGGIDSSRIMTFGTPDEVEDHVKSQIRKATTLDGETMNGGYIPGPAHDLLDTPLLNVETVVQSIAKYGKYPLNWL
ncbi:MAG: uroporphyrinogen decarboxylase family protein [Promethearchaeota archaeon]